MNEFVADTMAMVLWLEKRKIPSKVKSIFKETEALRAKVYVPILVLAEVAYLAEKNRIDLSLEECRNYFIENQNFCALPMTIESITAAFRIDDISERHDRLISAEGVIKNIPTITNDPVIASLKFTKTLLD